MNALAIDWLLHTIDVAHESRMIELDDETMLQTEQDLRNVAIDQVLHLAPFVKSLQLVDGGSAGQNMLFEAKLNDVVSQNVDNAYYYSDAEIFAVANGVAIMKGSGIIFANDTTSYDTYINYTLFNLKRLNTDNKWCIVNLSEKNWAFVANASLFNTLKYNITIFDTKYDHNNIWGLWWHRHFTEVGEGHLTRVTIDDVNTTWTSSNAKFNKIWNDCISGGTNNTGINITAAMLCRIKI